MMKKHVTFAAKPKVIELKEDADWRQARVSNWMQVRADHLRFQQRIKDSEKIIGPVLLKNGQYRRPL